MKRNAVIQGIALGFITGLIVTLFDGLYLTMPELYIPTGYPALLICFNAALWSVLGGLSGVIVRLFVRSPGSSKNELFYWTLFFLVPFTVIYGTLGKLYLPHMENMDFILKVHKGTFDYHLSFIWAGLVVLFVLFRSRTMSRDCRFSPVLLLPELIAITALFQFCSNPECLRVITLAKKLSAGGSIFLASILYILGTAAIFMLYALFFFKVRPKLKKLPVIYKPVIPLMVLLIVVIFYMGGVYAAVSRNQWLSHAPASASSPVETTSARKPPSVILIVLDTLRASGVTALQNSGFINNLDSFARDSLVFETCVTPGFFTFPSHASLFTGVYPPEHGCETIAGYYLADGFVTLAEQFRAHGCRTAAVVSNYGWLNNAFNMLQGFELTSSLRNIGVNHTLPFHPAVNVFSYLTNIYNKVIIAYRIADDINATAFAAMNKIAKEPFFLFLNYMDVHTPYRPPRPYDSYFLEQPFPQLYRLKQYYLQYREKNSKDSWDKYLLSQYYGELAYLDSELGNLMQRLKQMNLYDSSLIVITSDHGELFGEHGYYSHYTPMFEGIAKLPLMIKFPKSASTGSIHKIINLTDVYPTILSICGLPVPKDISGIAFGDEKTSGFAGAANKMILYEGRYKYMDMAAMTPGEPPFLFDLKNDPEEMNNLYKQLPEITLKMKQTIDTWQKNHKLRYSAKQQPIPDDAKEKLKSLGYAN